MRAFTQFLHIPHLKFCGPRGGLYSREVLFRREVFPSMADACHSSFICRLSFPFLLQLWRPYASSIPS